MVATTRRPNADTPARWDAALDRALIEGVRIYRDIATGAFSALAKDGKTLYSVAYYTCSCQAGQGGDPVCKHRASFRAYCQREDLFTELFVTGEATPKMPQHLVDLYVEVDETGEPESSDLLEVPEPDHRMCTGCMDSGWARMYLSGHLNDYVEVPCGCGADVAAVA